MRAGGQLPLFLCGTLLQRSQQAAAIFPMLSPPPTLTAQSDSDWLGSTAAPRADSSGPRPTQLHPLEGAGAFTGSLQRCLQRTRCGGSLGAFQWRKEQRGMSLRRGGEQVLSACHGVEGPGGCGAERSVSDRDRQVPRESTRSGIENTSQVNKQIETHSQTQNTF